MNYWVLKTEPESYSFDDLARAKTATWDGVKNPVAIRNLAAMEKGDALLIYHTGAEKAVVATGTVVKPAYTDPKSGDSKLLVVDVAAGERLATPVTLAAIRGEPLFADLALVRQPRLSVVPLSAEQYERMIEMALP